MNFIGSPFISDSYNEAISSIDDQISSLESDLREQKDAIRNISYTLENIVGDYLENCIIVYFSNF